MLLDGESKERMRKDYRRVYKFLQLIDSQAYSKIPVEINSIFGDQGTQPRFGSRSNDSGGCKNPGRSRGFVSDRLARVTWLQQSWGPCRPRSAAAAPSFARSSPCTSTRRRAHSRKCSH